MAVIDAYDKLEVTVEIDARTAREHESPDHRQQGDVINDGYTITDFNHEADHLYFRVEIDGFSGGPGKSDEGWYKRAITPWDQVIHSFYYQQTAEDDEPDQYNFIFQSLEVEDKRHLTETRVEEDRRIAEDLGTIKVCCFYAKKNNEDTGDRSSMPEPHNLNNLPLIAEGALDGRYIDCYTRLDRCYARAGGRHCKYNPVSFHDPKKSPFAILSSASLIQELGNAAISRAPNKSERTTIADAVDRMKNAEARHNLTELLQRYPNLAIEQGIIKTDRDRRGTSTQASSSSPNYRTPSRAPSSTPY
ncbi:hypothetical protein QBC37DRAFT_380953 [Rhypophila decipiens]|uniref:DUF7918 domain-containing protein n=1 Tax=Rhypophila decipiens TaxID=261697 RepID=A0AAN6XTE6_9PEZI|nr:hypothetical protein QBC37DRAFT_380953 [Rhypophila decipiens]